jgi:uncharacterized RDD family membrane protein YckC
MTTTVESVDRDQQLQGRYAGIVTRLGGFLIDVVVAAALFALGGRVVEFLASAIVGEDVNVSEHRILSTSLLAVWVFIYCAYPLAVSGRTVGMAAVGVRAVRSDGSPMRGRDAIIRVLVTPLSFALLCFGFLLILLRRDRRALQDLIAGTAVVYGWDARAARLRFLARGPATHP